MPATKIDPEEIMDALADDDHWILEQIRAQYKRSLRNLQDDLNRDLFGDTCTDTK